MYFRPILQLLENRQFEEDDHCCCSNFKYELFIKAGTRHVRTGPKKKNRGPAKAGPLFSGLLVSFPDCRDSLRTRRMGQVFHASSPLPCVYMYVFLVIIPPVDQEHGAARPDCIGTHVFSFHK